MILRALTLTLLTAASFVLSACGLTPVYGEHSNDGTNATVNASLSSIYIDNIPDRTGQRLKNLLMDHLYEHGRPGVSAAYRLQVYPIAETIYGLGIAKDATATRSQIRLATIMVLQNATTGERLLLRDVKSVASFNTLASQYTTLITEEDARTQTIEDLAQQIQTQLELYFSNPAAFPTKAQMDAKAAEDAKRGRVIDYQGIDWTERTPSAPTPSTAP